MKKTHRRFSRLSIIYLITSLLLISTAIPVNAMMAMTGGSELPQRADKEDVILDGKWHDYNLEANTFAYCPIYLSSNGHLTLKVQTQFEDGNSYVYLLDSDLETIEYKGHNSKGSAAPESSDFDYYLTAGYYYIRIDSYSGCHGLFRIRGTFTPAVTNEIEPNNSFEDARPLTPNGNYIRGFLSTSANAYFIPDPLPSGTQDFADYYTFHLDADTWNFKVSLLEAEETYFKATLYDNTYAKIDDIYLSETDTLTKELSSGTYYLAVESNGRACGQYAIQLYDSSHEALPTPQLKDPVPSEQEDSYEEQEPDKPFDPEDIWNWIIDLFPDSEDEDVYDEEDYDDRDEDWDYEDDWDYEEDYDYNDDEDWDYDIQYGVDETDTDWINENIEEEVPNMDKLIDYTVVYYFEDSAYVMFASSEDNAFTWMDSVELCERMGGHLVCIDVQGEQDFISEIVMNYGINVWMGGYKANGVWKWVTGDPLWETAWSDNEPNGSGDFLQMYSTGLWDDTYNKNYTVTGFICEWEY